MSVFSSDPGRSLDAILLGRVAIDFNPAYNDAVQEDFKPLKDVHVFEKFVGGSPANIAVGLMHHGHRVGFIGKVSDDQFGDYVTEYFDGEGIDTSHITRCTNGENLGLTFTEMLSPSESSILMYRRGVADLQLGLDDIDEAYIADTRALLVSGTALAQSPSREAVLKAVMLARRVGTPVIFDIDYRAYSWAHPEEISLYCASVAREASLIMGSREEFDLMERLVEPGMDDEHSAAYWQGCHAEIVVIKHGMEGSCAYTAEGDRFRIKPFPVSARKGFGGGDGYAAGFLHGLLMGWDVQRCLEFGSAEASMMVRANNCSDDLPDPEAVQEFIDDEKRRFGDMVARA